jgi:hypothetical protein
VAPFFFVTLFLHGNTVTVIVQFNCYIDDPYE